jgi:hypothetical protein
VDLQGWRRGEVGLVGKEDSVLNAIPIGGGNMKKRGVEYKGKSHNS